MGGSLRIDGLLTLYPPAPSRRFCATPGTTPFGLRADGEEELVEIPWHVRSRGWFYSRFWPSRFRDHWVRYWESQGISEEAQMQWAAEAEERESRGEPLE